jgi:hypothetical protein
MVRGATERRVINVPLDPRHLKSGETGAPGETLKVLVALEVRAPKDSDLERLRSLGLEIDRTIGDKLAGRIEARLLKSLRGDPAVREVEIGSRLRPHDG